MTFEIFHRRVMTFRNSREHCGRLESLDCACSAKRELVFELVSEILRVDGSDMASLDGVVLGSFVAQVRGIRFSDFGVSGVRACRGESVVVGRRPDNVHDVWHSRLSISKHSNTLCLRHTHVVFIGQLKLVNNSFSNLVLLQLLTLGAHARGLQYLLTLGAHARGLQYSFCLSVCVSVCLCVCFPYSGTSRNQAYKQQYQRLQRDTGMKYKKGFFFKTLRSEVMASFTHLE